MSWKPEILAFGESEYCRNGLTFATEGEALLWAEDLSYRWTMVKYFRAVQVDSNEYPVNYKLTPDHKLEAVK